VDYGRVEGELPGGAFAPFTNRIWFIEAPYESAAEATRQRRGLPLRHRSTGRRTSTVIRAAGVLVHMIEEYARHNGHADLLRERIDGRVGQ
jgi:Protein of unknown function (DUF664)